MRAAILAVGLVLLPALASAQHEGHGQGVPQDSSERTDVLSLPMTRNASGTAWQPDVSPHTGLHFTTGSWNWMFHELLFGGFIAQTSRRGHQEAVGIGWLMLMVDRDFSGGRLGARVMLSPEPWTAGGAGYPLLLQTGETWRGERLIDRQHPHDLFMELALLYTQSLGSGWGLQLYAAPAGEPALGPVAFPHRASAMSDPLAPISHHWLDSTHISFGVLTAAILTPTAKLEVSYFNGLEPDENRTNLDLRVPDSWSARLTAQPSKHVSAQVSYGFLPHHDPLEPNEPQHRLTASVMVHTRVQEGAFWATTFAFGRNVEEHSMTNAFLVESNLDLSPRHTVFGRVEAVQKSGEELGLDTERVFPTTNLVLGYLHNFGEWAGFVPGIGVRGAAHPITTELGAAYGTRVPLEGMIFARLSTARSH